MKILLVALLVSHLAQAQYHWNEGVAVLNDRQVLTGEFSYAHSVLLAREKQGVTVLPSHKVYSFRFYDAQADINRHYISLDEPHSNTKCIFEVVVWGKTSIVRKEIPFINSIPSERKSSDFNYFAFIGNELIPLKKFRTKVYPKLLLVHSYPLQEFIRKQKLNPNHLADAIRIVQFSNKNQDTSIAGL
jgi:hypothetical protein